MRRRPLRSLTAMVALVLTLTGCGVRETGIVDAGAPPSASPSAVARITVYLLNDKGHLVPVLRAGLPGHPYIAVDQLAVQPTEGERRQGLHTEVPDEIREAYTLTNVEAPDNGADRLVVQLRETTAWTRRAHAQLACTAAAIPGIRKVVLSPQVQRVSPGKHEEIVKVTMSSDLTCDQFDDLR
ncbi:hypothetical protein J4573_04115 [Actinomadura barringtoniae]|uniref:GerMN domain-containing protein n=1 Tax=Actinomadura barringtoniae TaxID=1427535 RepID=A0A939P6B0_9ACTN|nr:hypothetical protein [Actinomadura barringtoniae]MBO2446261.1 hypothetical protein [Actinomadura barringtoniae]